LNISSFPRTPADIRQKFHPRMDFDSCSHLR
jgi:hypothetical protein